MVSNISKLFHISEFIDCKKKCVIYVERALIENRAKMVMLVRSISVLLLVISAELYVHLQSFSVWE